MIADQPLLLVVRKDLPVNNLKEFIAYAKANQSKMQHGSAGVGSATHLGCLLFNAAIGVDITHIPYKGGAPAMTDLIAGRIDYWCPFSTTAMPQVKGDTVKPIALLSLQRLDVLPDLPTAHEQGLSNFEASTWNALFLPKGTPPAIVQKLHNAVVQAVGTAAVRQRLTGSACRPRHPTGARRSSSPNLFPPRSRNGRRRSGPAASASTSAPGRAGLTTRRQVSPSIREASMLRTPRPSQR